MHELVFTLCVFVLAQKESKGGNHTQLHKPIPFLITRTKLNKLQKEFKANRPK